MASPPSFDVDEQRAPAPCALYQQAWRQLAGRPRGCAELRYKAWLAATPQQRRKACLLPAPLAAAAATTITITTCRAHMVLHPTGYSCRPILWRVSCCMLHSTSRCISTVCHVLQLENELVAKLTSAALSAAGCGAVGRTATDVLCPEHPCRKGSGTHNTCKQLLEQRSYPSSGTPDATKVSISRCSRT